MVSDSADTPPIFRAPPAAVSISRPGKLPRSGQIPQPIQQASDGLKTRPLLRLGFRPFYLLAAIYAAFSIPLWIAQLAGLLPGSAALPGTLWHAHEMLFGFALAVITGFLFTAGKNWTGQPTPTGWQLGAISLLWIAARALNFFGPAELAAFADLSFVLLVMAALARAILRSKNYRNLFVLIVLGALLMATAVVHFALPGWVSIAPSSAVHFGAFVVAMLASVMGGRVIPSFTANALPGVRQFLNPQLDLWAIAVSGCGFLLFLGQGDPRLTAAVCICAFILQSIRLAGWNPWATRRTPLLWILHLSYAWIPISLALIAASNFGLAPVAAAIHALTIGALGGLMIGMMTRTALGHTARPLTAGPIEVAAFILVPLAAVMRIAPLLFVTLPYLPFMSIAALCWSMAFVLYLVKYLPILTRARLDGRDG